MIEKRSAASTSSTSVRSSNGEHGPLEGNLKSYTKVGETQQGNGSLNKLFQALDRDKSGKLEPSDLKAALQDLGLPHKSQKYVELLLDQYHANEQKEQYIMDKESKISQSFQLIDRDHSGEISAQDLEETLKKKWLPVDAENARRMIHLLDKDEDGAISLEEFKVFAALLPETQVNDRDILNSWADSSEWMEGLEYNFASVPPKPGFNRVVASGVAGGLSKSLVAPIDRLRIMMMANRENFSLRRTAVKMWNDGGYLGLFRGNLATMMKIVPQTATQFAVYDRVQAAMVSHFPSHSVGKDQRLNFYQYAIAGGFAGAASSLVSYPLETVRTHMSVCARLPMHTIVKEIGSTSGLKGYYRGIQASMTNSILTNALGFAAYEAATDAYRHYSGNLDPGPGVKGLCAGLSACAIMAVVMPLENVQGRDNYPVVYHGTRDCIVRMYKAEGLKSFWRGSFCSFMKVAPSLAVVRMVYEVATRFSSEGGTRQFRYAEMPKEPTK